jgi:hypothetical protein
MSDARRMMCLQSSTLPIRCSKTALDPTLGCNKCISAEQFPFEGLRISHWRPDYAACVDPVVDPAFVGGAANTKVPFNFECSAFSCACPRIGHNPDDQPSPDD